MTEAAFSARSGQRLGTLVLDQLKERLLDGRYAPGAPISIEELKTEFGVSKQPVMDALRRLDSIGIVEIVPQSGCRVAAYPPHEVRDFFHLFGRFEGEIAAAAAARRTDTQLAELDAAWDRIDEIDSLDSPSRSRGYRFLNRHFHLAIHQMAQSRVMADLSARMWDMSDFFISTVGGSQPIADAVSDRNHDHDVIRRAIRSRNVEVARVAMQSHITATIDIVEAPPAALRLS